MLWVSLTDMIIHMKKILYSDWLRAVQFKCNTRRKRINHRGKLHHNSGLGMAERHYELL